MATFWVDSEGTGSDSNDGTSLALAKRTLAAGLGLITGTIGNTLNVVARKSSYPVTATTTVSNCTGTSYASFGCRIRSTDLAGTPGPDLARITWENSATAHTAIRFQGTSDYCVVEGFELDRRGNTVGATSKKFVEINATTTGHIRVRYCIDRPQDSPVVVSGRLFEVLTSNTNDVGEVSYCYFLNARTNTGVQIASGASCKFEYHHSIHEHNISQPGFHIINANFGATTDLSIHHNTIIVRSAGRALVFQGNHTSANAAAKMTMHSNLVSELAIDGSNTSFMFGNTAWENVVWSGVRDIGWNLFTTIDSSFFWSPVHPYQVPWDTDNLDVPDDTGQTWATDVVRNATDPFNDSDSPWIWPNVNGSGYNIRLSGDFRLKIDRTAGKAGDPPGAIAEAVSGVARVYLSGGASNADPKASLGGVISSHDDIAIDTVGALFDDVTSGEATSGTTEYRCYYVKNPSETTWFGVEVWIQADTSSPNTALAIGLDPVGNGDGVTTGVATTITNETTAPTGVAFTAPTGSPGLSIGNLTTGQARAVWVRRTVNAGATAAAEDRSILRHSGTDI